jgi:alkylhydroperoxidase family enzyme
MARLPMVPLDTADERLRAMFDGVRARGVEVPNLYRVLGQAPAMLGAWLDFAWPLRLASHTDRALRELLILRGAEAQGIDYEWVHHVPMARAAGVSAAQINALADWRVRGDLFGEKERAVLRLAEEVAAGPASAACIDELKRLFADEEVIELVLTASFYVCVGRVLGSLAVDLEPGLAPQGVADVGAADEG